MKSSWGNKMASESLLSEDCLEWQNESLYVRVPLDKREMFERVFRKLNIEMIKAEHHFLVDTSRQGAKYYFKEEDYNKLVSSKERARGF